MGNRHWATAIRQPPLGNRHRATAIGQPPSGNRKGCPYRIIYGAWG
ncbi:MAG: hypothetical protein HZB17_16230 [Chloroflexi bacterium]|nr:hypothetical protein [Chloroflexota bacterium]